MMALIGRLKQVFWLFMQNALASLSILVLVPEPEILFYYDQYQVVAMCTYSQAIFVTHVPAASRRIRNCTS